MRSSFGLQPRGGSRLVAKDSEFKTGKTADMRKLADVLDVGLLIPDILNEGGVGEEDVEGFLADIAGLVLSTDAMEIGHAIVRDPRSRAWDNLSTRERQDIVQGAIEYAAVPGYDLTEIKSAWFESMDNFFAMDFASNLRLAPRMALEVLKVNLSLSCEIARYALLVAPGSWYLAAPLVPQSMGRFINVSAILYWLLGQAGLRVAEWMQEAIDERVPGLVQKMARSTQQVPPTRREQDVADLVEAGQTAPPAGVSVQDVAPGDGYGPAAVFGIGALVGGMLAVALVARPR